MASQPELILVCRATVDASTSAPCPQGQAPVALSGYVSITPPEQIDPAAAREYWSVGFTMVLSVYVIAAVLGQIIKFVKDAK